MCNTGIAVVIWNAAPFDTVYRSAREGARLAHRFCDKNSKAAGFAPCCFFVSFLI